MKNKGIKQIVSMLLAVVMILSLMPVTAMARTITPVKTDGGINLRTDATGKLLWIRLQVQLVTESTFVCIPVIRF